MVVENLQQGKKNIFISKQKFRVEALRCVKRNGPLQHELGEPYLEQQDTQIQITKLTNICAMQQLHMQSFSFQKKKKKKKKKN